MQAVSLSTPKKRVEMIRRTSLPVLLLSSLSAALVACASTSPPAAGNADTVYVNGKIVTVDKSFSIAQAVAVKDGKFVGVGSSDDMRKLAGSGTRVVDLKGQTVIPGLMDSHSH